MKNLKNHLLFSAKLVAGVTLCLGVGYLGSLIFPLNNTKSEIKEKEINIKKDLTNEIIYRNSEDKNNLTMHNFNTSYGLIILTDYNKDNVVDEIYFSNNPLTKCPLEIKRPEKGYHVNSQIFQEADKIYQKEIKRFKE